MINNYELQVRCIELENNDIFPLENTGSAEYYGGDSSREKRGGS